MIAGETVRAAGRGAVGFTRTPPAWRHRFLAKWSGATPSPPHGIVAADETSCLASFKGRRDLPRARRASGAARRPNGGCRTNSSRC